MDVRTHSAFSFVTVSTLSVLIGACASQQTPPAATPSALCQPTPTPPVAVMAAPEPVPPPSAAAALPAKDPDTTDQAEQQAITPDQALMRLRDGNARFVAGGSIVRDYAEQVHRTAAGQYPFAEIVACMDSRSSPELVFDQGIGDLFSVRVAGNIVTPEITGSVEYATKVIGAKLIVVLGHSSCGAVKGACDNVKLGSVTSIVKAIQPAVKSVKDVPGERTSKNDAFVAAVADANVRNSMALLHKSAIIAELEKAGQVRIVGGVLDVKTGKVAWLE